MNSIVSGISERTVLSFWTSSPFLQIPPILTPLGLVSTAFPLGMFFLNCPLMTDPEVLIS